MPNLKFHCNSSFSRTGKSFEDLHKWMDEGQKFLKKNHRFERHSTSYIPYVMDTWKKEGVIEFLNHIIDDYKNTLSKYSGKCVVCNQPTYSGKKLCLSCYRKFNS